MKKTLLVLTVLLMASSTFAQTRIAFTTAPAPGGFVDAAQKAKTRAVADLVADFTKRAKKDNVTVVAAPADAQLVVTVLSMGLDPNGETTKEVHRGLLGGVQGSEKQELAEHMVVELRAGEYMTTIHGWKTIVQSAEDQVGREIRRWLKDNAKQLP